MISAGLTSSANKPATIACVATYVTTPEDAILSKLEWQSKSQSDTRRRDVIQMTVASFDALDLSWAGVAGGRVGDHSARRRAVDRCRARPVKLRRILPARQVSSLGLPMMQIEHRWRAEFTSLEVNFLHANAFGHRLFSDEEWDWRALVERHSLGWVVARTDGRLVGFVNVIWDGLAHAWLQDLIVSQDHQHMGIGTELVRRATGGAREAGCEWLHVDFDAQHRSFYIDACGFRPAEAGLLHLA